MLYDLDLFFDIFSKNNKILLFIFGEFAYLSKRKLKSLPNNISFLYCGTEYVINNKLIKKVQ